MVKIKYAVGDNMKGDPREIIVPTVVQANRMIHVRADQRLDHLVSAHGQLAGAEKYMRECFTTSNLSLLELHDGTGCLLKLV